VILKDLDENNIIIEILDTGSGIKKEK